MQNQLLLLLSSAALATVWFTGEASAEIQCHYCGLEKLCPLPYTEKNIKSTVDDDDNQEIRMNRKTCPKSCIKFDGFADDGKRVLVRDCSADNLDTNECKTDQEFFGAKGTLCYCNAENCNGADPGVRPGKTLLLALVTTAVTLLMPTMM